MTTTAATTTTFPPMMAELKAEPAPSSMWHNYGSPVHMSTGRFNPTMEPGLPNPPTAPPQQQASRPRTGSHSIEQPPYPYSRFPQEEPEPYDRHQHPGLAPHQSYPNLKRTYSQTEQQSPYQDMVQDIRDDNSKLNVNHDHKLLSFKRVHDKTTILDQHGRIQQLELSAQLHGMFFLSEMPSSATDGSILQPELTCYRRNLFQISGSLVTPRGQLSVVTESGETVAVSNMEVTISAIESVDGNPVRLIVIPWKTPPPNSPEISQGPDQEPQSLPLIPFQDDPTENEGEYAVYPIGWRRLQFRIATANNGRRKELQQHFVLHLKVMATLANGSKSVLTESTTAPIVVRGRSPRNFQARKEIPLLGSSAGSRGQALVETGLGIVAGPLTVKPGEKPRGVDMQVPRTAFTFTPPKAPSSQMGMRSNSYPSWNPPSHVSMPPMPVSSPNTYSSSTMSSDPYHKVPMPGSANFTAEPQEMPLQSSMPPVQLSLTASEPQPPIRTQYAYAPSSTTAPPPMPGQPDSSLSVPRYVDNNNPRPSKSPRHANHESVHSAGSMANSEAAGEYRYSASYHDPALNNSTNPTSGEVPSQYVQETNPPPPRDYYPPSGTWTSTAGGPNPTAAYANGESRAYTFPESYKGGNAPPSASTPAPPPLPKMHTGSATPTTPVYNNGVSNYSWSAS